MKAKWRHVTNLRRTYPCGSDDVSDAFTTRYLGHRLDVLYFKGDKIQPAGWEAWCEDDLIGNVTYDTLQEAKKVAEGAAFQIRRLQRDVSPPRKISGEQLTRRRIAKQLREWHSVAVGGAPDSGGWGHRRRKDGKIELLYKGYLSLPPRVVAVFEKDLEGLVEYVVWAMLHEPGVISLALELVRGKASAEYLKNWEFHTGGWRRKYGR